MDVEDEWEYLPDATYLLPVDGDARRPVRLSVFNMDYFSTHDSPLPPPANLLIPTPQFVPASTPTLQTQDQLLHPHPHNHYSTASSQVFFNNNNEFVDMKLLDSSSPTMIGFEDKKTDGLTISSPRKTFDLFNPDTCNLKNDVSWVGEGIIGDDDYAIDDHGGLNLWKLGISGIGAICSFGVAAAAISVLIFGNNHKRMKQVVQQATKFNEAMAAAVRGVPLSRARITYGGYYDNAL
uniref:DUF6821 domain-containing protein n=1 Tax=Kalanchoe fedtschenkoi TaxID=63787 RepID=A0A7N0V2T8_KALFE